MQKIIGTSGVAPIACINPNKDKWAIRWNIKDNGDGTAEYMEEVFMHKPTEAEIKDVIIGWHNSEINTKIVSGFKWNGISVWLSQENQFNYKAAHDAAVMSNGATLPAKFKLGTDEEPKYWEFTTVDELSEFYYQTMAYIQSVLTDGWNTKDNINFKAYQL